MPVFLAFSDADAAPSARVTPGASIKVATTAFFDGGGTAPAALLSPLSRSAGGGPVGGTSGATDRQDEKGGGYYFAMPKTSKSNRPSYISSNLISALKSHRMRQLEAKLGLGPSYRDSDLIFANEIGRPLLVENVRRRYFDPILKAAGLPLIRLYDLRHTSATLFLASGEHPKVVAERLGHASTNLTLDTYPHVLPNMQQGATNKIQKLIFGT